MKVPHLRWVIAGLLFTATVINYIDRQALSVVAPVLTKELGLTPIQYAGILQGFLYAYTIMYLVSGILVDRWGTRLALAVFMAWWSISNMLHSFAHTAGELGAFRILLGIGEPGNFMAASRATSEWYPPKERAFLNGVANSGAAVGAIISAPLIVWLYVRHGWRSMFVVTGCLGFVWLLAWLLLYHLPEKHPLITAAELRLIKGSGDPQKPLQATKTRWIDLLRYPQTWGLFWSRFLSDPVWWFYLFWLPKYLVEQRGFTMVEMGMLAWLPYLTADIGSIFGGLLSGYLVKREWPVLKARSAGMLPFALLMPLERHHRLYTLEGRDAAHYLHRHIRAYGLENEPDDAHQRHLSHARGRLGFGAGRLRQWLGRRHLHLSYRPYRAALFLQRHLHHHGFPASRRVRDFQTTCTRPKFQFRRRTRAVPQ